jgi:hypothetical protein
MSELGKIKHRSEREQKEHEQKVALRDKFEALYSEWPTLRAVEADPNTKDETAVDLARTEREYELARLITITPAVLPWMVFQKLDVLEYYLCANGEGTDWSDNREIVMLAGIKADLITFGLSLPSP